jgi:hypothetical protein
MARDWIDEGLRHLQERAEQQRLASEHRHHQMSVIKEKGPVLMRGLLDEIRAVVDEYRSKARAGSQEIAFEELPHEGFFVTRTTQPKVDLQCRPGYEAQVLYCNMTRVDDHETDPVELVFSLDFGLDESDSVELREGPRVFKTVGEAVEFLLKPVLFPVADPRPEVESRRKSDAG